MGNRRRMLLAKKESYIGKETETGFIFYDKGSYSDGWRFIECAKTTLPNQYVWGDNGIMNLSREIGQAIYNRDIIISKSTSRTNNASKACKDYALGAFEWALPTYDEASYIYSNLISKGIVTFNNRIIWIASENTSYPAYAFEMYTSNGSVDGAERGLTNYVLPIRYFS